MVVAVGGRVGRLLLVLEAFPFLGQRQRQVSLDPLSLEEVAAQGAFLGVA